MGGPHSRDACIVRGRLGIVVMLVALGGPQVASAAPAEANLGTVALAEGLAGAPCEAGCCVPVRVVLERPQPQPFVQRILRVVDQLWASYGIGFVWTIEPNRRARSAQLRVVLDDDGDTTRDRDGRFVMASIPFLAPGRPHPAITASLSKAKEFVRVALRAAPPWIAPWIDKSPRGSTDLLTRALGRSIAHEIGHYLTANSVHAPIGLMRAHFGVTDLVAATSTVDRLTPDDLRRLWRPDGVLVACAQPGADSSAGEVAS